jgi:hypothetical protein
MAKRGQYGAEKRQKELKKKKKREDKLEQKRLKKLGNQPIELDQFGNPIPVADEDAVEGDAEAAEETGEEAEAVDPPKEEA